MGTSSLVRRLLGLLAASSLLGAVFLAASPAALGIVGAPCASVDLASSPLQQIFPGATVTLTASSTGCPDPEYQFYLQPPGGAWSAAGAFSSTTAYLWNTTGLATGTWGIGVRARQSGTSVAYDVYWLGTYTLAIIYCGGISISADTLSPQPPGTSIVFTASRYIFCGAPQFRFLALPPGGSWTTVRPYSTSTTFTWDTAGLSPGTWQIGVWVRQTGSAASYDAYALTTFTLSAPERCQALLNSASLPSPQLTNTVITFTGLALPCSTPEYEFWLLAPGGTWAIVRAYSTTATFAWNTTGIAVGRYQVGLWGRQVGSTHSYDRYVIITYYINT